MPSTHFSFATFKLLSAEITAGHIHLVNSKLWVHPLRTTCMSLFLRPNMAI